MTDQIQLFNNPEFGDIRTTVMGDSVLFCGKDIAEALGYASTANAIAAHCKGATDLMTPTNGGPQLMKFITEGDVYRLVCGSRLEKAEKFERWIFDEVLPSVRKHGAYLTPEKIEEVLDDPDTIIQLATKLKQEREHNKQLSATCCELGLQNKKQEQYINELKPKADYTDLILCNRGLVTTTQIAKDYGMSGEAMNAKLHELNVQYKQSGQWLLYRDFQSFGYTHSSTMRFQHRDGRWDVSMSTKWTQKGRLFIYNLLKKNGILPVIEREQAA
jgi:prophage antirepressor-like protein